MQLEKSGSSASPGMTQTTHWKGGGVVNRLGSKRGPGIVYFLFYALAVNIPMWVGAYFCGLGLHGWISLDFILVGILGVFLPRSLTAVLLGLAVIADATAAIAETYFLSGHALFENLFEVRQFDLGRILIIAAALALQACSVLACLILPRLPRQLNLRLKVVASLALFAVAVVGLQYGEEFWGTGKAAGTGVHLSTKDVVSAAILEHVHLVRSGIRFWFNPQGSSNHLARRSPQFWNEAQPGAAASAYQLVSNAKEGRPDIVVVLLESWGLASDAEIRQSLVSEYSRPEITSRYQVEQGTVPFWGATAAGEARELCSAISSPGANSPAAQDCLPQKLRALGYRTIAVHGMSGLMYNRVKLYPRVGFDEMWFREKFDAAHLPRCAGAFRGTCDTAIADWIGHHLEEHSDGPQFIYWMTLGSHLPVPNPPQVNNPAPCSVSPLLAQDVALCAYYQLVFNVHRSVFDMATAALARPTIFVVVGDHAPPFAEAERRNAFSNAVVPYVLLIPRQFAQTPSSQLLALKPATRKSAGDSPPSPPNSKATSGP